MLIVGREIGQSIIIGNDIKVTVIQSGIKPRLAINAPAATRIAPQKQSRNKLAKNNKADRNIGESFRINENIEVALIQTSSGLLRFAIDAPKDISIFREEIYESHNPLVGS